MVKASIYQYTYSTTYLNSLYFYIFIFIEDGSFKRLYPDYIAIIYKVYACSEYRVIIVFTH